MSSLPRRVRIKSLVESRYPSNARPSSWDRREAGVDVVETEDGDTIRLASSGQQSPPSAGWTILLRAGNNEQGFAWTLFGFAPGADVSKIAI